FGLLAEVADNAQHSVDFDRQIRPIFSDRCFACHGPDERQRKANLRLDIKDGGAYGAIVPGEPAASRLFQRISSGQPQSRMPLASAGPPLTPDQKDLVRRWITEGAIWENHWSYVAPRRPAIPSVSNPAWVRNAIDAFVLASLDRDGLK